MSHEPAEIKLPDHLAPTVKPVEVQKPAEVKSTTEQAFEQYKQVNEEKPDESPYVIKQARQKKDEIMTDDTGKSQLQDKYEEVMADGLGDVYHTMTPAQQEKFRKRGEEIAKVIEELTVHLKLTARKVIELIRAWLKMIPGINRYFLEQEAKLKTDEIMKLGQAEMLRRKHQ